MRRLRTGMLSGLLVFSLFSSTAQAVEYHFADAGQIPWAASSVEKLYKEGIMSGINGKTFAPDTAMTRAQIAAVLAKVAVNKPIVRTDFPFTDVNSKDWYYPAVKKLYSMGMIKGVSETGTEFAPNQQVTREEAAVILAHTFDVSYESTGFPPYADRDKVSDWAKDAVAGITKKGAFSIFGNQLQPGKAITRAETAVILHKLRFGDPAPYVPPVKASRSNQLIEQRLTKAISAGLGSPYKYGGSSTKGFDCSGFTGFVYGQLGVDLPRDSRSQYSVGDKVSLSDIEKGDLIFFDTGGGQISHVGIYVGNNKMAHAPSSGGNTRIDDLEWYYNNYKVVGVKRVM